MNHKKSTLEFKEYCEELKFDNFEIQLERESFREFNLDFNSHSKKLFISFKASLNQVYEIINEIENYLSDSNIVLNIQYLDDLQVYEDDDEISLEFLSGKTFIILYFSGREEVVRLQTELKKASGWTKEIFEQGSDYDRKVREEESQREEDREERNRQYQKEIEEEKEASKPLIEYISSKTNEEIVSEIIDYIKKKFPVEKLVTLKNRDINSSRTEFFAEKGFEDIHWWHLPEKIGKRYRKIRFTLQDDMEDQIQTNTMELIEKLVPECVNITHSEGKKKFSYSDLDEFLFSKKLKISTKMRSLFHSKINKNLKN